MGQPAFYFHSSRCDRRRRACAVSMAAGGLLCVATRVGTRSFFGLFEGRKGPLPVTIFFWLRGSCRRCQLCLATLDVRQAGQYYPTGPCVIFPRCLQVRGTDMMSPHGVPIDLLDRLVIIRTQVSTDLGLWADEHAVAHP